MRGQELIAATALLLATTGLAGAWDQNPFDQYMQRSDTITMGAGNAKARNTATHMINPWPGYVMDRNIPGDGQRQADAVDRYRKANVGATPCPIVPQFDIQTSGVRSQSATQCATAGAIQSATQQIGQPGTTTYISPTGAVGVSRP